MKSILRIRFLLIISICLYFFGLNTVQSQVRTYTTSRISNIPTIDGKSEDPSWTAIPWVNTFTQREPDEGQPATQQTEFKIAYDDNNIYVLIRALDNEPDKIERRLSRRDGFEGDQVAVSFDSYNDKKTAFTFNVSASGVKNDYLITDDGNNEDYNWDPIWYVKTSVDDKGWVAEMKIPLSQLRFSNKEEQTWGLQVVRRLFRKQERSLWQFIPQSTSGWVNSYAQLNGIRGIKPKRQIELIPYTVGKLERFEKEEGNPFSTGKRQKLTVGLDGKIGITNDLTLDFTINPDFGQVEADPSQVNLSAFESFYGEKRPFFIEGRNITSFGLTNGDGDTGADNLFYSRRIGRSPQYYPDLSDNEYIDRPENTSILGALKLNGKTKNGLSIGIMESLTSQENAEIDSLGKRRKITVEPMTNYFVGRVQKDMNKGNTVIGGMVTAVNRFINDEHLNFLRREAYTGGVDFKQYIKEKKYYVSVKGNISRVEGNEEAITNAQRSSLRYFQRPDADYVSVDSSRTSLTGHAGTIEIGKSGYSGFRFLTWLTWRSPEFEINDIGFLRQADNIQQVFWAGYRIGTPFSIFRSLSVGVNQWQAWDFGGKQVYKGGNINFNTQFKNYWSFGTGINREGDGVSNSSLWGGPSMVNQGGWGNWTNLNSDDRKKITLSFGSFNYWGDDNHNRTMDIWGGINARPINTLSVSISPEFVINENDLQYVETPSFASQDRYIFAHLEQKTLFFTIRFDYNITPELTIQYYGQPFVSSGKYTDFKRVVNPRSSDFNGIYQALITGQEIHYNAENENYTIDENRDGTNDYEISKPDFNFFEFHSNLVMRWEYIPGSTVYLVWSQGRTDSYSNGDFNFRKDMKSLFDIEPHNVFLIKFSYRLLL